MIGGYSPWFLDELARRVATERAERAEVVLNGMCSDFADYRFAAGFFEGLQKVLDIADDIRKEQDAA